MFSVLQTPSEAAITGETDAEKEQKELKSAEDSKKWRPLLPKSALLRLLSEVIKSYGSCTHLITQHMYFAGQSEMVPEVNIYITA